MDRTITVEGMHCTGCERTVEDAFKAVDGVTDATADREVGRATVSGNVDASRLVEAVGRVGYRARL